MTIIPISGTIKLAMSKQKSESLIVTVIDPDPTPVITAVVSPFDHWILVTGVDPSVKTTSSVTSSPVQPMFVAMISSIIGPVDIGTLTVMVPVHPLASVTVRK
jgi:hypothetical protein